MNNTLKREIILHIFKTFGVFSKTEGFLESLVDAKFLLDKKFVFETEDKKKYQNDIWACVAKQGKVVIKIIIADISEDIKEYGLILQIDDLAPYALRLSEDLDDFGTMFVYYSDHWVDCDTSIQAKTLTGVESLKQLFLSWNKDTNYKQLYEHLINFLNYHEELQ